MVLDGGDALDVITGSGNNVKVNVTIYLQEFMQVVEEENMELKVATRTEWNLF